MNSQKIADQLKAVRSCHPLVHHITNTVTINDCANITLCVGGAPVMAAAPEEAAEMAGIASVLVLNIGTLSCDQVESMLIAGRAAMTWDSCHPRPVGAGAKRMRTEASERLLAEWILLFKGNAGELGCCRYWREVRGWTPADVGDPASVVSCLCQEVWHGCGDDRA